MCDCCCDWGAADGVPFGGEDDDDGLVALGAGASADDDADGGRIQASRNHAMTSSRLRVPNVADGSQKTISVKDRI
jgi:hypothetical protein